MSSLMPCSILIGSSRQTIFKSENFSCSWWEGILFSPPGKIIMFSPKVSDLWTENRFFLILFSRREWVGNPNQSIFPVPVVQLSPNFLHMVLNSLPRYHAKNFLIVSPFVYFLVYSLIKIPSLAEIPSWPGQRELPIGQYAVIGNVVSSNIGCSTRFHTWTKLQISSTCEGGVELSLRTAVVSQWAHKFSQIPEVALCEKYLISAFGVSRMKWCVDCFRTINMCGRFGTINFVTPAVGGRELL